MKNSANIEDEIDLLQVIAVIWAGKWRIVTCVLLMGALSLWYALTLPDRFTSEALLLPRENTSGGGSLARVASQYGGLANLAGIDVSSFGSQRRSIVAIEILKSRLFFSEYLYEQILEELMAAKSWDSSSGALILDSSHLDVEESIWTREASGLRKAKPTVQEAHAAFVENYLSIEENSSTGFVKLSITHISPVVAKRWVDLLVSSVNEALRTKDIEEAEASIAFVKKQRTETRLVYMQEIFSSLIEDQTKNIMFANSTDEYVFSIIDPPVVAEVKSDPKRTLICLLGMMFGGVVSLLYILVSHYYVSATKEI